LTNPFAELENAKNWLSELKSAKKVSSLVPFLNLEMLREIASLAHP
jgi:hypothetical protein